MKNPQLFINPGITPMPGRDMLPLLYQDYPAEIVEDTPWLCTHSAAGWLITDLYAGLTWITHCYGSPEDLQKYVSTHPWPEDLL